MKKVLKPLEPEDVVYYSDFSGTLLQHFPPVTVKIECDYGSDYDEARWEMHLTDAELNHLLVYIKDRLCQESKEELKKQLDSNCLELENFYNKELYKKLI